MLRISVQSIDRDDLQHQLFRRYTLLFTVVSSLALWLALNHHPFSLPLLILWAAVVGCTYGIHRLADIYPTLMRRLFVAVINGSTIGAMLLWNATWVFGIGMLFAFIGIILLPRFGLAGAVGVLATAVLMSQAGLRDYPTELFIFFLLSVILAWLAVDTLYTALHWYRAMHNRADQLLQEARHQRSELKRTLKSLEVAYEAQQRIHAELINARKHAEETRRLKEQFAANISHELRTPLNIILGFSEVMHLSPEVYGANMAWSPTLRRDISQVYRSSSHLLNMIDDILDLSHFELSEFSMEVEPTSLTEFLLDTMGFVEDLFKDHPATLIHEIQPDLPVLAIDRTRIRQVILNLLNNAKRFTMAGWVRVEARLVEADVMISVTDTGIGIAEEDLPHIFDEFYQADYSISRKHGGAGLGLAVSKHFVQAHKGLIWVDSRPGEGAKFTFTLPVPQQVARAPMSVTRSGSLPAQHTAIPCIAVVETDSRIVDTVRRYLTGYDVIQASGDTHLKEILHTHHPEAVIYNAPQASTIPGSSSADLEVPYVICAMPSQAWVTGQAVILSFLAKPITSAKLLHELSRLPDLTDMLVIDDDRGFVQMIARIIEASPLTCTVQRAYTGQEGLALMRDGQPDVVLLDLVLPDIDGLDVLNTMQAEEQLRDIPVILLTARSDPSTMQNGRSSMITIHWPEMLFTWQVLRFLQQALPGVVRCG